MGKGAVRDNGMVRLLRVIALMASLSAVAAFGQSINSGTVSGQDKSAFGSILELAWRGTQPITLPNGEVRRFVEDGDEIILRARCARDGAVPIGFGDCRGVVEPAIAAG